MDGRSARHAGVESAQRVDRERQHSVGGRTTRNRPRPGFLSHNLTGPDDPRLGDIHAVLLSHVHGDHIGDQKLKAVGAGTCANSGRVPAGPHSMTAEVAAAPDPGVRPAQGKPVYLGTEARLRSNRKASDPSPAAGAVVGSGARVIA